MADMINAIADKLLEDHMQLMAENRSLRQQLAACQKERDELITLLEHIRRCIPIGGFAQIHDGSATVADIDAALAKVGKGE